MSNSGMAKNEKNCAWKPLEAVSESKIINNWKAKNKQVVVTIICHTYQHCHFIEDALNGFLMQKTEFPFEVIVRDDASTDGTKEIVEKYAKLYPSIIVTILEEENTFSKGVKPFTITYPLARGKYIAFCEGDDYWTDPEKLQKQVEFLEQRPEYVVTYHDAIMVDKDGKIKSNSTHYPKEYSKKELMLGAAMPNLTRCYRKVFKGFPPEFYNVISGDTFVSSLLGNFGKAKCLKDIAPAVYRQHNGGIWAGAGNDKRRCAVAVTFFWLAVYYKRTGRNDIADKHALSSIMAIIRHLSPSLLTTIKIFLYSIFRK